MGMPNHIFLIEAVDTDPGCNIGQLLGNYLKELDGAGEPIDTGGDYTAKQFCHATHPDDASQYKTYNKAETALRWEWSNDEKIRERHGGDFKKYRASWIILPYHTDRAERAEYTLGVNDIKTLQNALHICDRHEAVNTVDEEICSDARHNLTILLSQALGAMRRGGLRQIVWGFDDLPEGVVSRGFITRDDESLAEVYRVHVMPHPNPERCWDLYSVDIFCQHDGWQEMERRVPYADAPLNKYRRYIDAIAGCEQHVGRDGYWDFYYPLPPKDL